MRAVGPLVAVVVLLSAGLASAGLPTVTHEGHTYIELFRVAESLRARLDATPTSTRAELRSGRHVVTLTRNWAQVLVNGKPHVLKAPVRVKGQIWLVPEGFVAEVLPKVQPAMAARVAVSPAAMPRGAPAATPGGLKDGAVREVGPAASARPTAALEELRYRSYPSFTRVVLETSTAVTYRIESSGPGEARVRILGLAAGPEIQEIQDGYVAEVRLERAGRDGMLRVSFEGTAGEIRASTLVDPPRLVLDFRRPVEPHPKERREALTPLRTIVLDAGHGGHDSGAVGPGGLQEKELVLDVTRRVALLVEERLGLKVLLSRTTDQFVPLRDRTSFANRERADLFVSIHANAHRHAESEGVETYFLSSEATDSEARQVAAVENGVVQLEKPTARGRVDAVKAILWDLAQSEFQFESSRLAEVVQDSMTQSLRIPTRGVKQAGFYVLGGAAMPAILVEIGFVSNPREERRLKEARYRDEIARAIFAGLAEYKRLWDQRMRVSR